MELGLSPPHRSSSPEDLYPAPGTPPGTPPPPDAPLPGEVKRSQPLPIPTSRKLREEELRTTSLPSIPNPFPELCSPPSQTPILGGPSSARGLLPRDTSCPHVVKVYSEDGASRSVEVAAGATARYVCEMLVQRAHALSDENWGLVECHPHLALERGLEDHESVVEVQAAWPIGGDSRFVFRKNFAKYELFKSSPHSLFPEKMVSSCLDTHTGVSHEDLIQNFLNAGSFPEIQGFLQLRGSGRKLWKRFFCFLRRSGLYYSTKGTSKDPRHLQYVADVNESNVYVVTRGRKLYGMPTDFGFCIKPNKLRNGHKGLRVFCSEDEQSRTCWLAAFRLFKYGVQLYKNYQQAQSRHLRPSCVGSPPLRSVSDNTLVAMDFSGHAGRVIENPREVLSAALEEAHAWRKKTNHRLSLPTPCSGTSLSTAIHRTQPWFHGRISREESQRLITQQGLVDGLFLVRESQRNPQGFVLSLCHLQKVKHYLILPSEEEGRLYFSMDEGQTRFTDLLQLVEFHQLNRGILPCLLRHCCTCVAL
ncbi:PREDICTED: growth factor receptor-bound protein 7 isoform X1 [Hipposideros armiger]|uniref:Growth factor receptor-bound protein 7 isoform X1 n=1 Tax=Hipposideros armiger TaxID=186990 RepID=A0A8B7R2I5_HIPAR|nr:PREDICTED: growth factor receptor-bound protein 7 isoform X1 [Hipposideros armiger]XP_019494305.1 PREDICTED: growth factor receptor-bound protein 7 isoform X1 [Hipposideros armiger]XP_019494306.1 PREDICTED: growth factor receptor-bound protein 7 isoform X1 [Hipposideros armiger]XP_019494307.1 PREDICTED: growth factor receptor-bound protein 7 isoform X1 [Hipposideros armiger]XP_019494308.1 PREDICTED: growth factor receptor-bound protein 7 isoform X1 [Hipposideros armiger]XP_019494310.1 PREDI